MFLGGKPIGNTSGAVSTTSNTQTVVPSSSQVPAQATRDKDKDKEALSVVLRVRPFTTDEIKDGKNVSCVTVDSSTHVTFHKQSGHSGPLGFTFNTVLGPTVTQEDLFKRIVKPYMDSFFQGTPSLIFCYGVTNAGKTFTVSGTPENPGIVPRVLNGIITALHVHNPTTYKAPPDFKMNEPSALKVSNDGDKVADDLTYSTSTFSVSVAASICASINSKGFTPANASGVPFMLDQKLNYALKMSYLEVYNDNVYDLLADVQSGSPSLVSGTVGGGASAAAAVVRNREVLAIAEQRNQTIVRGLKSIPITSVEEGLRLLQQGSRNRISANTLLNTNSSRSHAVITFNLISWPKEQGSSLSVLEARNYPFIKYNKFSVIDLAGTERAERTNNTGAQLNQASNINNSLMTFRRCIEALRWNQKNPRIEHAVPFRECKLTRLFHDFFVGNGKAMMIVNVSPSIADHSETKNVLSFSTLAREVILPGSGTTGTSSNSALGSDFTVGMLKGKKGLQALLTSTAKEFGEDPDALVALGEEYKDTTIPALLVEILRLKSVIAQNESERIIHEIDLRSQVATELSAIAMQREEGIAKRYLEEIDALQNAQGRTLAAVSACIGQKELVLQNDITQKVAELRKANESMQMLQRNNTVEAERVKSLEEQLERTRAELRSLLDKKAQAITDANKRVQTITEQYQGTLAKLEKDNAMLQEKVAQLKDDKKKAKKTGKEDSELDPVHEAGLDQSVTVVDVEPLRDSLREAQEKESKAMQQIRVNKDKESVSSGAVQEPAPATKKNRLKGFLHNISSPLKKKDGKGVEENHKPPASSLASTITTIMDEMTATESAQSAESSASGSATNVSTTLTASNYEDFDGFSSSSSSSTFGVGSSSAASTKTADTQTVFMNEYQDDVVQINDDNETSEDEVGGEMEEEVRGKTKGVKRAAKTETSGRRAPAEKRTKKQHDVVFDPTTMPKTPIRLRSGRKLNQ